ncbi:putative transcriptional regulatory protein C11D3.07c [Beauveria bassiana]|nr:putative transcriptional regulatory protein C11D3.07c [Beauveria bassiana]
MEESVRPISGVSRQRACDECRLRKIRCDRNPPCSHCRSAGLTCQVTSQRPKEHKDRIQVTKQYEDKIDRIESRLGDVYRLLQQASSNASSPPTQPKLASPYQSSTPMDMDGASDHEPTASTNASATGNTGLWAESIAAKNVFQNTIDRDPDVRQDPQLNSALESLHRIFKSVHQSDPPNVWTTISSAKAAIVAPLPAWPEIKAVLERAERQRPMAVNLLSPALYADFCQKCRSMYENRLEGSTADKMLVYSGLSNICSEFSGASNGDEAERNHNLAITFFHLLSEALTTLPALMPPSMATLEALFAAALTAVSMCKPLLSWSLSCIAARMCQALGYHRLSRANPKSDPWFHRKVMLFWSIYTMDRGNALRLGYAPAIQDYDIDTPMPVVSEQYPSTIVTIKKYWVDCARVQGQICTRLYGPAASALPPAERAQLAEAFADELDQIYRRKVEAKSTIVYSFASKQNENRTELWTFGDDIMYLSTRATALHAIPPNHERRFRATQSARECLHVCRDISNKYRDNGYAWTIVCHWVLLHTPLTAFMSIFCHIVAYPQDSGQADFEVLNGFVASLQPAQRLSDGIEKFHNLCSIFLKVAQAYLQAKMRQRETIAEGATDSKPVQFLQPANSDPNQHLSGLKPSTPSLGNEAFLANHVDFNNFSDANYLEADQQYLDLMDPQDWYSGNASIYSLLEHDYNGIN